jgi:hypothetical protein
MAKKDEGLIRIGTSLIGPAKCKYTANVVLDKNCCC